MIIKNCSIVLENSIKNGSVLIKNNKIVSLDFDASVFPIDSRGDTIIDGKGLYLSPGFIDCHIHGAGGCDTMDGTCEALNTISKTIVQHGTTSFLPTTMTCSTKEIKNAVEAAALAIAKGTDGAQILGVHLEGPFISPSMIGAQNPGYIQLPSIEAFKEIVGDHEDIIKSITLAPEVNGAEALIRYLTELGIAVSMGHSKASYDEAIKGIEAGISHSTHLYNAMTPLHHREPGVVGAIFDTDITTEIICDGIHIAYPAIRTALKQKSVNKVLLMTDAMSACCMEDGSYSLGGQAVIVNDGAARLKSGALAGSVLTIDAAVRNLLKNTDYTLPQIISMATCNAAKHCKTADTKGYIKKGYEADLILFDKDITIKLVIISGKLVYISENNY